MPRHIAVLDVGKTNAKLVVHDLSTGHDVFVRTTPNLVRADGPYPHHDLDGLWAFFLASLKDAAEEHPIDAVSISAHGASIMVLDADGVALPMLDYEFAGPDECAADYDRVRPSFAETRSPRLPQGLNPGAQLFWLENRRPEVWARARTIITYPQYWAYRLSGVIASERTSLGCHSDLWNPGTGGFSTLAVARGWDRMTAPVRSAFDVLGPVTAEVAAATGLAPDTPVLCGIHDSNASLLPHLLARIAPFTVVSTGTWVIVFAVGGSLDALDPARDGLCNVDAYGRPVPGARYMGGREFEMLMGKTPPRPEPADVRAVIEGGVMILPALVRGCGPFPRAAHRWTGDPDALSPGERAAAVSLYVALMTRESMRVGGAAGPTVVEGPFCRNELFAEALERLTGRPVIRTAGTTGTSTGAAMLALGPDAEPPPHEDLPRTARYDLAGLMAYADAWAAAIG